MKFDDVNLKYTIDANVQEPIMLLEGSIGADLTDSVNGAEFSKELLYLDTLNKKSIQVWINSEGGSVTHGNFIYNTILLTKTPVNTLCVGMAASIAFVIFQSGKKRTSMSNAFQMMHNPYNPKKKEISESEKQLLDVLKASIVNSIALRSGVEESKVSELMDKETYYGAKDCLNNGFCDEVINVNSINNSIELAHLNSDDDLINYRNQFKPNYQNLIKKTSKMDRIKNKLNLSSGIAEDHLENEVLNRLNLLDEVQNKLDMANIAIADFQNKVAKAENELQEFKNTIAAEKLAVLTNEAKDFVNEAAKIGRIKDDEAVKAVIIKNYIANPDDTKAMVNSFSINKKGEDLEEKIDDKGTPSKDDENEYANTLSIQNRLKEKRKNKIA